MKHFRQLFLYALLCTVTGLSTKCTFGQPFSLVKDINTTQSTFSNSPANFITIGNTLYFTATTNTNGNELWKSDGTTAGTVLVKDIRSGIAGSFPENLTNVNGTLFFQAFDDTYGEELWKSDGTTAGTVLVKDIRSGLQSSTPVYLTNFNGTLFFAAFDNTNGQELWKSDGTTAGTVLVKDINSGPNSSNPFYLTNVNGTLFFTAFDATNGRELWKSDGTTAGTLLVKDIYSGSGLNSSSPGSLTNFNGTLFFTATDATNDRELWKSDGTTAGTVLVKDIFSGGAGSNPGSLTNVNGTLFFAATDAINGTELWKSDGTTAGTFLIKDILSGSGGSSPVNLTNVNGTLFFTATDATNGNELWKSDGTTGGTVLVKDIRSGSAGSSPGNLTNVNGTLFFTAFDDTNGRELWKSDGTANGTVLVQDIISGSRDGQPQQLTLTGTYLFLVITDDSYGQELWGGSVAQPGLSIDDVVKVEGNAGTSTFSFTVSLSAPSSQNVSFGIATIDGSATAGSDYVARAGSTQTISAGSTTYTFDVTVNGDVLFEGDEIFMVTLFNPVNATITDNVGWCTINDDDPQPGLSIDNVTKAEGNAGTSTFSFTVSLSAVSGLPAIFQIATADGTAVAGSDYVARAVSTQSISAGSTTYTFDVTVNGDVLFEGNETFMVNLSNPINATITDNQGVCTINNDDAQPGLSIDNVIKAEGDAGTSTFSFTVSLSAVSGLPATFQIATADGTAMAGSDYVARAVSTQSISAGSTTYTFDVTVNGDNTFEVPEIFLVNITNATNAVITNGTGIGTITNDDPLILPVKIAGFTATKQGGTGLLNWQVAQEENIATYTIERSADGRSFITVGLVTSLGNTTAARSYHFTDASPINGTNYYRLKITEKDGKVFYSEIRLLNFGSQIHIALFPNPAKDKAVITGVEAGMIIRLLDAVGKVVLVKAANSTTESLALSSLSGGLYNVQVYSATGTLLTTARLVKD